MTDRTQKGDELFTFGRMIQPDDVRPARGLTGPAVESGSDQDSDSLPGSGAKAAFLEIGITPPFSAETPIPLQGMEAAQRRADKALTPLQMQLLLLEDQENHRLLIISADIFGFGWELTALIRQAAAAWGLLPEQVVLNASHTHYGPGTVSNVNPGVGVLHQEYVSALGQAVNNALPMLEQNLRACTMSWGSAQVQVGVNRRLKKDGQWLMAPNPEGAYRTHTPIVRLDFRHNKKSVLLISHGCHPTGLGGAPVVSADYPFYMRQALIKNKQIKGAMFLQGALGSAKQSALGPGGQVVFANHPSHNQANGQVLAQAVLEAMQKGMQPFEPRFTTHMEEVSLPYGQAPSSAQLRALQADAKQPPLVRNWAGALMSHCPGGSFPLAMKLPMQFISLGGPVTMAALPVEPLPGLAEAAAGASPQAEAFFFLGCSNGLQVYLPDEEVLSQGGYESQMSHLVYLLPAPFKPEAGALAAQALERGLKALQDKARPRLAVARFPRGKKGFWVMSSGRCGTMSLAGLLDASENAKCWHHPLPYLVNETLQAYRGEINLSRTFWRARASYMVQAWEQGLIYGETDLNMTPFCQTIAEELPEAKFLILMRDPRHFIRSGMRRQYYQNHPWDSGRLRPKKGSPEHAVWARMEQFEKVTWLWAETYRRILAIRENIGPARTMVIRFEDLVSDLDQTKAIYDFLGLSGFDKAKLQTVLDKKLNAQQLGIFPAVAEWDEKLNATVRKHCAELAQEFGYDLSRQPQGKPASKAPKAPVPAPVRSYSTTRGPKVTVGLPLYNSGHRLGTAIESILAQDFEDFELVISDNCSDDGSFELCEKYAARDKRIKLHRFKENLGRRVNFARVLGLAAGDYFVWVQDDNKHKPAFLSACLEQFELEPEQTVLVYPQVELYRDDHMLGLCKDTFTTTHPDPAERYRQVIWKLGLCNAILGLVKIEAILQLDPAIQTMLRAADHLMLAELAIMGKIVQIDKPLMLRNLTRNPEHDLEQNTTWLIETNTPKRLNDGISMPLLSTVIEHLNLVNRAPQFDSRQKSALMQETLVCFKQRFGGQIAEEVNRALKSLEQGKVYKVWGQNDEDPAQVNQNPCLRSFHAMHLVQRLAQAQVMFPESQAIAMALEACRRNLDFKALLPQS